MNSKALMRKQALAGRRLAFEQKGPEAADAMANLLLAHKAIRPYSLIAGYVPMRYEIDPMPAMKQFEAGGHLLLLPVIDALQAPLRFRRWNIGEPLVAGPFGTLYPAQGAFLDPDVILVPMVAFDLLGHRLGYGGGFYDRTLQALRPVLSIGLAFAAQELSKIPHESTDQRLDAVVTEQYVKVFEDPER